MQATVEFRPSYALAICRLEQGESIKAESGAMVSMDSNLTMVTASGWKEKGGLLKGLKRLVGGESFFQNTFNATKGPGEVALAPTLPGDVVVHELDGTLMMQSKAYMASTPEIAMDTQWGGGKGFFSGAGMFLLKATGRGTLIFNSFGAVYPVEVGADGLTVDTGHIVAFEEGLNFKVRKFGNWKSFFLSGEGLVCEFSGRGRLWLQSRNTSEFGKTIGKLLPPRKE